MKQYSLEMQYAVIIDYFYFVFYSGFFSFIKECMHLLFAVVDNTAQNCVFRGVIYVIMRYGCVNCQGTSFLNDESITIDFDFYCALINKYDFIQAVFMPV